ncbi:MAG: hypothetical protein F2796_01105 [Actinobacteria bacterium]|nr:hypothetical protein [Actinomycetota bacterium]
MKRLIALLPATLLMLLLLAPLAYAATDYSGDAMDVVSGEGAYGIADDKVVTNAWFIALLVIPLFILTMSLLQWRLEKRKEARKAAAKKLSTGGHWQSGW